MGNRYQPSGKLVFERRPGTRSQNQFVALKGQYLKHFLRRAKRHDSFPRLRRFMLFVPLGHPIIAHRFIGGFERRIGRKAPQGATDLFRHSLSQKHLSHLLPICRPYRDLTYRPVTDPPLKGWAIIGRPKGTKSKPNPFGNDPRSRVTL